MLSLALVSSSDNEHGSTIHDTQTEGSDSNTGGGGLLRGRSIIRVRARVESIVGLGTGDIVAVGRAIIFRNITKEVNVDVDLLGEVASNRIIDLVDARVGRPQVHLKSLDKSLRVVELGNGGNVTISVHSVVGNKLLDLNGLGVNTGSFGKSHGQVREDLTSSLRIFGNEVVVQAVEETNLNGHGTLRSDIFVLVVSVTTRSNSARVFSGNALRGSSTGQSGWGHEGSGRFRRDDDRGGHQAIRVAESGSWPDAGDTLRLRSRHRRLAR